MLPASSSSSHTQLALGIEIELLIRPKAPAIEALKKRGWTEPDALRKWDEWISLKNAFARSSESGKARLKLQLDAAENDVSRVRTDVHAVLAQAMGKEGIPAAVNQPGYAMWKVVNEPKLNEIRGFWKVEIVSKVLGSSQNWQSEVKRVFDALHRSFDIHLTKDCSMHVHVSPGQGKSFTVDQVRSIVKATAYYDKAITEYVPAERKNNPWAVANFSSPRLNSNVKKAYDQVLRDGWGPVFRAIDSVVRVRVATAHSLFNDRSLSWNFSRLADDCGTVEFRRPPGVSNAASATEWAQFTLSFVRNAIAHDWSQEAASKTHANSKGLVCFVGK
ncbi:hypothetical protein O9K51_03821 [Purpureocillium lavendulum]|uniref:Amidoligase enzyme n=1 Tax=Purpureocillium lavendulum TaxID=1247861 RepID=A0AB34FWB9_9HYPO|nr:hypothetical protein O9K51_03821 [Purpureocillium lavendulum]